MKKYAESKNASKKSVKKGLIMDIKEYTSFLVKSIVKNPDMVKVEMFETEGEDPIIEIIVHHDDFGAVYW